MDDFVTELAADPTYSGIDVPREWGKAMNWCRVNNRKATRRFFVNWLNKIEKPISASNPREPVNLYKPYFKHTPQPMSEEQRLANLERIRRMIKELREGMTPKYETDTETP